MESPGLLAIGGRMPARCKAHMCMHRGIDKYGTGTCCMFTRGTIFSSRDRNRDILSTFYSDILSAILFDMCSDILIMIMKFGLIFRRDKKQWNCETKLEKMKGNSASAPTNNYLSKLFFGCFIIILRVFSICLLTLKLL